MTSRIHAQRRDRLRAKLAEQDVAWFLVSHAANRYYLSGFELFDPQCNESAGFLLLGPDEDGCKDFLLTDPRYLEAAKRHFPAENVFIYAGNKVEAMAEFLRHITDSPLGFESKAMSVDLHASLSKNLDMRPLTGVVEALRLIKEPGEIEALRRACALNHQIMAMIPEFLTPGRTEKEVAWDIERSFREAGASALSFPSIVAVGENGALPHAIPGEAPIPASGPVLVDMGCRLDDYCSDQTRTFWVGERAREHFRHTLDLVRGAQEAALAVMRPGLPVSEAYAAAYQYFAARGVEDHFTHALGHGIGLETHEPPSLAATAKDVLEPNMVVTVEPGLYYPEWGGVRWEYMVLVTEHGVEPL